MPEYTSRSTGYPKNGSLSYTFPCIQFQRVFFCVSNVTCFTNVTQMFPVFGKRSEAFGACLDLVYCKLFFLGIKRRSSVGILANTEVGQVS